MGSEIGVAGENDIAAEHGFDGEVVGLWKRRIHRRSFQSWEGRWPA